MTKRLDRTAALRRLIPLTGALQWVLLFIYVFPTLSGKESSTVVYALFSIAFIVTIYLAYALAKHHPKEAGFWSLLAVCGMIIALTLQT
jgi:hypothetical protein